MLSPPRPVLTADLSMSPCKFEEHSHMSYIQVPPNALTSDQVEYRCLRPQVTVTLGQHGIADDCLLLFEEFGAKYPVTGYINVVSEVGEDAVSRGLGSLRWQ